ncbi:MAG: hypothetical protein EPN25_10605 [Nitrospirae bacterium]|nr:MAG: hypothetical protein EPN25_10605 [Nitrospirota bacterium]
MKRVFSCIIFLLCVFAGTGQGGNISGEGKPNKLEEFMRKIIILSETYSLKKNTAANNSEFDLTRFKITTVGKKLVGSNNHYNIQGTYMGVVRTREDMDSSVKAAQKNGAASLGDKHTFTAEVLEKKAGDFQIISLNRNTD